MRGIYAFAVSLALVFAILLASATYYARVSRYSKAFLDYRRSLETYYLEKDLEITLRQAAYFGLVRAAEILATTGDLSAALSEFRGYLMAWVSEWASYGVSTDLNVLSVSFVALPDGEVYVDLPDVSWSFEGLSGEIPGGRVAWSGG